MRTVPSEFETPIDALSSFDPGYYDRLVADIRKKHAEREAAKAEAIKAAQGLEENVRRLLRLLPELEARGVAVDQRRLASAERMLFDGVVPSNTKALADQFERNVKVTTEFQRAVNKLANALHKPMAKIDTKVSASLRRVLLDLADHGKRLTTQYRLLMTRAKKLAEEGEAPQVGPIQRAASLYKAAVASVAGVHSVGTVYADSQDVLPVYELPVAINPDIFNDRKRLREIERELDDFVEQRDPISVGAVVLRFEPAAGAA